MLLKSTLIFVFVCLLVSAADIPVLAQNRQDIAGSYDVEGTNPGGRAYRGMAQITKDRDTYRISWVIGSNETYVGIGILEGNVLAVSYSSQGMSGVVAYRVEGRERLEGRWAILGGNGEIQTETLTRR